MAAHCETELQGCTEAHRHFLLHAQDAVKRKRKRDNALPEAFVQLNTSNAPLAIAKRCNLVLPPTQVSPCLQELS